MFIFNFLNFKTMEVTLLLLTIGLVFSLVLMFKPNWHVKFLTWSQKKCLLANFVPSKKTADVIRIYGVIFLALICIAYILCFYCQNVSLNQEILQVPMTTSKQDIVESSIGMVNPASANCMAPEGTLEIRQNKLGEYGVCLFEDNRQCEEWALFRGECPVGGLKIAGYDNDAEIYCAITGGQVEGVGSTTPMCK